MWVVKGTVTGSVIFFVGFVVFLMMGLHLPLISRQPVAVDIRLMTGLTLCAILSYVTRFSSA
jgi:hypothetical protein